MTKPSLKVLSRYLSSTCTPKEKLKVEAWINSSERNKEFFDKLRRVWELSGSADENLAYGDTLQELRTRVRDAEMLSRKVLPLGSYWTTPRPNLPLEKKIAFMRIRYVSLIAAALVAFLGTLYATHYIKEKALERERLGHNRSLVFEEASTKPGQQVTFMLADGTKITLNSMSDLRYGVNPDGSRNVYLKGEAFFDVVHSVRHPFIVHAGKDIIRDAGTKFDVRAWPDDSNTRVSVLDGAVSIQPGGLAGKVIVVLRNQYSVINNEKGIVIPPTYANVSLDIGWMSGRLIFNNDPMSEVFKQLRRSYGINCFASDTSILSRTITTSFDNRVPLDRVLKVIALSLKLKCKVSQDSVLFISGKSLSEKDKKQANANLNFRNKEFDV
ncbi:MAG: FecR domain-containing protein [Bacteroidetes bacterium]|nr:FecR domain-containing protein [Bacteroidota bacterium]